LHQLAKIAAQMHFDSHVIKMILESVQLLSAAWWVCEPEMASEHHKAGLIYKKYNANHPIAKWVRESLTNYNWLIELASELNNEHQYRYEPKQEHKSMPVVRFLAANPPPSLKDIGFTTPCLAMPDEYKIFDADGKPDSIASYRKYYMSPMKSHIAKWRKREKPDWFEFSPANVVAATKATNSKKASKGKKEASKLVPKEPKIKKEKKIKDEPFSEIKVKKEKETKHEDVENLLENQEMRRITRSALKRKLEIKEEEKSPIIKKNKGLSLREQAIQEKKSKLERATLNLAKSFRSRSMGCYQSDGSSRNI